MNSALPFAASPGFSTSGSSAATMSALVSAGRRQGVEQRRGLRGDLAVGMRAQPRDVGGAEAGGRDGPVLHRREQRERGVGRLRS